MNNTVNILVFIVVLIITYRYFTSSRPQASQPKPDFHSTMNSASKGAIMVAEKDYQIELDESPESIEHVEKILGLLHDQHKETPFAKNKIAKAVIQWGAYTGEVIKNIHPAHWEKDSEVGGKNSYPLVFEEEKRETFPVGWVHKRIVNGPDDNIWVKFQILIMLDQNDLEILDINDIPTPDNDQQ